MTAVMQKWPKAKDSQAKASWHADFLTGRLKHVTSVWPTFQNILPTKLWGSLHVEASTRPVLLCVANLSVPILAPEQWKGYGASWEVLWML